MLKRGRIIRIGLGTSYVTNLAKEKTATLQIHIESVASPIGTHGKQHWVKRRTWECSGQMLFDESCLRMMYGYMLNHSVLNFGFEDYDGRVIIKQLTVTGNCNSVVSCNIELQGTGPLNY